MSKTINVAELAKGALIELSESEIKKILENISDPNTDDSKVRKLTLELKFKPMDRESVNVSIQAKSSIVPYNAVNTQVFIGKDNEGNVVAEEYIKGTIVGQTVIDTSTGEIVKENVEEQPKAKKVVNMNR